MKTTTQRAVPLGSPTALTPGRMASCRRAKREVCATPGCKAKPAGRSSFCRPCGDRLARVRDSFEADGKWNQGGAGSPDQLAKVGKQGRRAAKE